MTWCPQPGGPRGPVAGLSGLVRAVREHFAERASGVGAREWGGRDWGEWGEEEAQLSLRVTGRIWAPFPEGQGKLLKDSELARGDWTRCAFQMLVLVPLWRMNGL